MQFTSANIGELIKRTRTGLGLTQRTLAQTAGTGVRFIIELEQGKPTCEMGKVLAVLNALDIDISMTARAVPAEQPVTPNTDEPTGTSSYCSPYGLL